MNKHFFLLLSCIVSPAVFSVTCFGMKQKEQPRVLNPVELQKKIVAAEAPFFDEFHARTKHYNDVAMKGILIYKPGQRPEVPDDKMEAFAKASQESLDFTLKQEAELNKKRLEIFSRIVSQNAEAFEQSQSK